MIREMSRRPFFIWRVILDLMVDLAPESLPLFTIDIDPAKHPLDLRTTKAHYL